jgi:hypothetical protein
MHKQEMKQLKLKMIYSWRVSALLFATLTEPDEEGQIFFVLTKKIKKIVRNF